MARGQLQLSGGLISTSALLCTTFDRVLSVIDPVDDGHSISFCSSVNKDFDK